MLRESSEVATHTHTNVERLGIRTAGNKTAIIAPQVCFPMKLWSHVDGFLVISPDLKQQTSEEHPAYSCSS